MIDEIYTVLRNRSIGKTAYVDKRDNKVFFIDSKDHRNCFEPKPFTSIEIATQYANAWINGIVMASGSLPDLSKRKVDTTPQPTEEIEEKPIKAISKPKKNIEKVLLSPKTASEALEDLF